MPNTARGADSGNIDSDVVVEKAKQKRKHNLSEHSDSPSPKKPKTERAKDKAKGDDVNIRDKFKVRSRTQGAKLNDINSTFVHAMNQIGSSRQAPIMMDLSNYVTREEFRDFKADMRQLVADAIKNNKVN